jgi:acetylornithine deacetylase
LKIRTKGLAAHSAYPERGKNAIYRMAPVVERLERLAKELSNHKPNPLLGPPSLSVGVIEGGQAVNTVPDECWIDVDRRSIPGETTESILESIKASLNGLTGAQMDPPYLSVAGMDVRQDLPIVKLLSQSVKEVTGSVQIEAAPYATDAGIYNSIGIPTVVFGPGNIAEAHTHAEFIELKQLEQSVLILQRLIAA